MRRIDAKYHIENDQIVKTTTGEVLPEDEPLILFRGKDSLLRRLMAFYGDLCRSHGSPQEMLDLVDQSLYGFEKFAEEHPERMKVPD